MILLVIALVAVLCFLLERSPAVGPASAVFGLLWKTLLVVLVLLVLASFGVKVVS